LDIAAAFRQTQVSVRHDLSQAVCHPLKHSSLSDAHRISTDLNKGSEHLSRVDLIGENAAIGTFLCLCAATVTKMSGGGQPAARARATDAGGSRKGNKAAIDPKSADFGTNWFDREKAFAKMHSF
jgi:hypothetical protein